jgi:hypothetical protein
VRVDHAGFARPSHDHDCRGCVRFDQFHGDRLLAVIWVRSQLANLVMGFLLLASGDLKPVGR